MFYQNKTILYPKEYWTEARALAIYREFIRMKRFDSGPLFITNIPAAGPHL